MKRLFIFFAVLLSMHANAQLVVDMTTGKDNPTGAQIVCGGYDDTWELLTGSGYVWPMVTDGVSATTYQQVYALPYNNCGKWISSTANSSCLLPYMPQQASFHEYKLTFYNSAGCNLTNARFEFDAIGADDAIYFEFNNNLVQYHVNSALSNCVVTSSGNNYSILNTSGITVPINPAHIVPGLNELRAYVCNGDRNESFYICGRLKADYLPDPNLIPSIASPSVFCSGSPITVTGSSATTNVTWHFWEMVECDASGAVTPGGYLWNGFYSGAPSAFSFPNSATAPCGTYYKIKLALSNPCTFWSETSQVIFLACTPQPAISGPASLCYGQTGTYTIGFLPRGWSAQWSTGGSGASINFTPTATTTLSVTVTDQYGCQGTATFTVTVLNTNPDFNVATSFNSPYTYYTCVATPVVTTGLPAGFGFAWFVEEVDASNNAIAGTNVTNPSVWWSSYSTNFCGYDGFNNSSYNGTGTLNCTATPVGLFVNGHRYRITRGTWSTDCGWQQISKIVYMCNNCRGGNAIIVEEDPAAPSYEYLMAGNTQPVNNFLLIPNPCAGSFSVQLDQPVENGTVEIFNMLGEKVDGFSIVNSATITVNTTLSKGIYMVRIQSAGTIMSQRLIIE